MAILAEFRRFFAKIAPHVEISIILTGFYVEKTIIFFILNELRNLVQESAFAFCSGWNPVQRIGPRFASTWFLGCAGPGNPPAFCDTPLFRGSPMGCWEPGQIMLRARGIVRNGEDMGIFTFCPKTLDFCPKIIYIKE